jgi:hypothetical protein
MLTALATTIASVTALVTALYTAGVIGHKSETPTPAPAPIVTSTPASRAGGNVRPANADAEQQPATNMRAENRRNAAESIEGGQYSLQSYKVNGQFVPVQGVLQLAKQPDNDIQFRSQVTNGALTYWYQGMIRYRNGTWREQILGSNDPTVNSIPFAISVVGGDGTLLVRGGSGVEVEWLKQ